MGQVIKVSTKAALVLVTAFHRDAFTIAQSGQRAAESMDKKLRALLVSRFGEPTIKPDDKGFGEPGNAGGPSFTDYRADQSALAQIARERKLVDNQYIRKAYAAAVRTLYGALPVAMTAEAIAKRAQRDAAAASKPQADTTPGAKQGETQERQPSPAETDQQIVARMGVFQALEACAALLAEEESTKAQAVHIRKMAAAAQAAIQKKAA